MDYELLLNKILRVSQEKSVELLKDYQNKHSFKEFAQQQKVLDIMTIKTDQVRRIKEEYLEDIMMSLSFMSIDKNFLSDAAFANIKEYPMILWLEGIGTLSDEEIINLLNNYSKELNSLLIETFIVNIEDINKQIKMIKKYQDKLGPQSDLYYNFYYSLNRKAQDTLDEIFPNGITDKLLYQLREVEESEVVDFINNHYEGLKKLDANKVLEIILLKVGDANILSQIIKLFIDIINDCSLELFELLFKRYRSLLRNSYYDEEEKKKILTDDDLLDIFYEKFRSLGIVRILKLFDYTSYYRVNEFTEKVILKYIDIAYEDDGIKKYINDMTRASLFKKFESLCNDKEYTIEDFRELVAKCGLNKKIVKDDFIEAIVACRKLMNSNVINDKHPLFLELREKFTNDLYNNAKKDGTYNELVNFNGLFYRLIKGSLPFDILYLTRTYRGLIYLSKCGNLINDADYITEFLSDEQLVKMNINPIIKWKKNLNRTNVKADYSSIIERMSLQLLCYFGENKGKYLIDANIAGNRMESLFDALNYKNIKIDSDGKPIVNEELIDFFFGRGRMNDQNTIINRLIRGEIMDFEKYFSEVCNNYEDIKQSLNGVLSVKRIINYFNDFKIPIELKPDEVHYKEALRELSTSDESLLNEAKDLLNEAAKRRYSTIPKVKGKLGDFTYEILDLDDPLAIAVGYLSHCCFKVRGISYSALKQSLRSNYGRTFVVYYKGVFLAQSWVWRNGDVVCFDSVESGAPVHGAYDDDINISDVYKEAASEIMSESYSKEDKEQRIKMVTMGRSDFNFKDKFSKVQGNVAKPIEDDVYVYDSRVQYVLSGYEDEVKRYGYVGARYYDPRKKPFIISDIKKIDIDKLDEILININALRYKVYGIEEELNLEECKKIISGDEWYIIVFNDNTYESGKMYDEEEINNEYARFMDKFTSDINPRGEENKIRTLRKGGV